MNKKNSKRSFSRLIAVQVLYQYDFYKNEKDLLSLKNNAIDCLKSEHTEKHTNLFDNEFVDILVNGVIENREKIDARIREFLVKEQNLKDVFLIQIIRLAVFEIEILKDAPMQVIIDEYVNISSGFYDNKIVNFVNGILDNIGKNLG